MTLCDEFYKETSYNLSTAKYNYCNNISAELDWFKMQK